MPIRTWLNLPVLCLILVVVTSVSCYRTRPTYCSALYQPVCGSDGKTYWNECIFRRHNCRKNWVTVAYNGRCKDRRCPRYCMALYKPVCGTDGQTYWNECELRQKTCNQQGTSITLAYRGPCLEPSRDCPHSCLMLYNPVCGSDGQTYFNECELKRHNCNKALTGLPAYVAHKGRCTKKTNSNSRPDPLIKCDQLCMTVHLPVCGTDGKTYSNKCFLNLANCKLGTYVALAHDGPCQEGETKPDIKLNPLRNCNRLCITVYLPVCGTDGQTYSNQCFLDMANCKSGTSVTRAHDGPCQERTTTKEPTRICDIFCTLDYSPVCGTDGKTYSNPCRLRQSNCELGTDVGIDRDGECEDQPITTEEPERLCDIVCTLNYSPVCGTDGKTYSNPCSLRESNCRLDADVGIARDGECENPFIAGGLGTTLAASSEIQSLVNKVRFQVEADSNKTFREFTAATYRIQLVAGINYFVKVKVDRDSFLHVRIYQPLPEQGDVELIRYQLDKTEIDTIEYF